MPASFSVEYEGRTVEVIPDPIWEQDRVRLVVDGETVAETKANAKQTVLAGDGFEVRAVMPFWGGSVKRASLVPDGGDEEYELDPEPGTRAARSPRGGAGTRSCTPRGTCSAGRPRSRRRSSASPSCCGSSPRSRGRRSICPDLPRIDLPDLPLPSFQIDLELPGWVQAVLDSKPYWVPIVVGVVLARRELNRRKKLRRDG